MGLDTVELVMEIEDTFQISIPDADAEIMQTPADVADWLVLNLPRRTDLFTACASARVFNQLRAGLTSTYGVSRKAVRPDVAVAELVPPGKRGGWPRFARQHHLPRPSFTLFRERFVDPDVTIRHLVEHATTRGATNAFHVDGQPIREEILRTVRQITADQMGMRFDDVRPDANFVNDLGMG